ncbi:MAG: hypothetical protein AAFU71_15070 [Cyanobacteria bacterium J06632_22]
MTSRRGFIGLVLVGFTLSLLLFSGCRQSNPEVSVPLPEVDATVLGGQRLTLLAKPGPWRDITGLIGYGDRLWFANSVAFENHNSADLYSYALATGETRYEQHLFSQSVGKPLLSGGLLYWPFEDPRFSADLGEYMVTDGTEWQWHILPTGEAFHLHTMAEWQRALVAGTGAWAGRIQQSDDQGQTWQVVYEHPTPPRQVSRITELASLGDQLYIGVTALQEDGIKLLRGDPPEFVAGWPKGKRVSDLVTFKGWLYGVNLNLDDSAAVWRTQATQTEQVTELDGFRIRSIAADDDNLWAVNADSTGGFLWHSQDGLNWTAAHRFEQMQPLEVTVYGGQVYVGATDGDGVGVLLGPEQAGTAVTAAEPAPLRPQPSVSLPLAAALADLDQTAKAGETYTEGNAQDAIVKALLPLARMHTPAAGDALTQRLMQPLPRSTAKLFEGRAEAPATDVWQFYLLWAIGLNGYGQVPLALVTRSWDRPENPREKYWHPAPAALWTTARLGQDDPDTIAALIARLRFDDDPLWLRGDVVGALTTLTGQQWGYDQAAWEQWWQAVD